MPKGASGAGARGRAQRDRCSTLTSNSLFFIISGATNFTGVSTLTDDTILHNSNGYDMLEQIWFEALLQAQQ
ncbi:MAG TPA: hypothetical protein VLQ48_12250 [Chloroflexia bacterium]|nr:hypothetical protein [Chloroflexia bacterium]